MLHLYGYSSHSTLDKALGENVTSMKVKVTGVLKSTNVIIFFLYLGQINYSSCRQVIDIVHTRLKKYNLSGLQLAHRRSMAVATCHF